ncbi:MAG TPA: alpha-L-fucosidase, partial [Pyrinomonadaceae bacterium]|nr:alpha-L-fucosidase [Pyrinomonadaceae bacterium]
WAFHKRVYGADIPYQDFVPQFKAELFDPDHWAELFANSGAKYVVLTSKHHEGFTLWPSKDASRTWGRPWNSVEIGPKRDLLGDLSEAVRRKGLRMGYYYSLYEWYNPLWLADKPRYVQEHVFPQFRDLVTRYKPAIIFSDGEWEMSSADWHAPELLAWLFNDSPVKDEVVINDRWGSDTRHKHGGYWTTEYTAGMSGIDHPWEENRGMGVSYGYNRAEDLNVYHTGRDLIFILVDTVSRGGNLLLDIGPKADGTIPVIMEQRLKEIGDWLKINGEAIYGTKPWKNTRQWTAGEIPKVEYNKEFSSAYDVAKLIEESSGGKASIETFFTAKGSNVYAILPHWSRRTLVLKDLKHAKAVTLLGSSTRLKFRSSKGGLEIELPDLSENLRVQAAWVLKIAQ